MRLLFITLGLFWLAAAALATEQTNQQDSLQVINQYNRVSEHLVSAATPELHQFQLLKDSGFEHLVILSTGLHLVEQTHAEALGLTWVQIKVSLGEPSDDFFKEFTRLMDTYGDAPVVVFSDNNWRAATYAHRYHHLKTESRLLAAK